MVDLRYFFMAPVSIVVATIAMAFGIGGAVMFSPIFVILFPLIGLPKMTAAVSFGAALLTETVGFASGFSGYTYLALIDWKTGGLLLMMGLPMSVMGTLVKHKLPKAALILAFAVGIFLLAFYVWYHRTCLSRYQRERKPTASYQDEGLATDSSALALLHEEATGMHSGSIASLEAGAGIVSTKSMEVVDTAKEPHVAPGGIRRSTGGIAKILEREIVGRHGERFVYRVCSPGSGMLLIAAGAFMTGLISAGIGETSVSVLHGQCRIPMRVAAATSVFVTLGVVFASSLTDILVAGVDSVPWDLVTFTMPGVLIGGQIGVRIGKGVSSATSEVMLIVLLLILGGAMLLQSLKGFGVLHWGDDN